jgi:alanine dehydrogenase
MLRADQVLFTYLHLAADPAQTKDLLASGVTAIGYETVTEASGQLPLLRPMSEVAGRMATQVGAQFLERSNGGRGILLGGVPGVPPARVLIIGSGSVGSNATFIAVGMGADVTVTASALDSLRTVAERFGSQVRTVASSRQEIETLCRDADLVIGAALVPGAAAPKLISAATVKRMKPGSVIVDVSIDQGGNAETSRPTTHSQPTFVVDGVIHYCVTNMPGAVPRTSTFALNNATRPFVLTLADKGWRRALADDNHLRNGLNVSGGKLTNKAVADALRLPCTPLIAIVGG